jgi:hypothetical protein
MTKTRLPSVGQVQNPKPVYDLEGRTFQFAKAAWAFRYMFWSLNIEIWDLFVI